jgi:hypothetical protein
VLALNGTVKDKQRVFQEIKRDLLKYIEKEIKEMKIETEVIEYKCKNNEKQMIGIEGFLNKLKQT